MARALSFDLPESTEQASVERQSKLTILLHWSTVIVIVALVAVIYTREIFEDKSIRQALLEVHRQLGLFILVGVAARLFVRYWYGFADHAAAMPALMRAAAKTTHWVLYGMLIALPLLGWATTSAHDVKLYFVSVVPLPSLTGADADFADELSDYHKWGAWLAGGIVLVHALAAVWHHFVRRDTVLVSMLPSLRPLPPRTEGHAPALARPGLLQRYVLEPLGRILVARGLRRRPD